MLTINYVPAKDRQYKSCDDCIGCDSEGYYVQCWIVPEIHKQRDTSSGFIGSNLSKMFGKDKPQKSPCKYHMTSDQYITLIDSLEVELGGDVK